MAVKHQAVTRDSFPAPWRPAIIERKSECGMPGKCHGRAPGKRGKDKERYRVVLEKAGIFPTFSP